MAGGGVGERGRGSYEKRRRMKEKDEVRRSQKDKDAWSLSRARRKAVEADGELEEEQSQGQAPGERKLCSSLLWRRLPCEPIAGWLELVFGASFLATTAPAWVFLVGEKRLPAGAVAALGCLATVKVCFVC